MSSDSTQKIASHYNCYDCKKELRKDEAQRYIFKKPDGSDGDCIIVCEEDYMSRMAKRADGSTSKRS